MNFHMLELFKDTVIAIVTMKRKVKMTVMGMVMVMETKKQKPNQKKNMVTAMDMKKRKKKANFSRSTSTPSTHCSPKTVIPKYFQPRIPSMARIQYWRLYKMQEDHQQARIQRRKKWPSKIRTSIDMYHLQKTSSFRQLTMMTVSRITYHTIRSSMVVYCQVLSRS